MLKRFRRHALVTVLALLPCACASVLGIDEPLPREDAGVDAAVSHPDGSVGDTGTVTPQGDAAGPCTGMCVPAAPVGWTGPYAYSVTVGGGGTEPSPQDCASPYATLVTDYLQQLNAPDAKCSCTCDPPTGIVCPARVAFYSDGQCMNQCGTSQALADTCAPYNTTGCPAGKQTGKLAPTTPSGGSCNPNRVVDKTPLSWGAKLRLCAVSVPASGSCANGELCRPAPDIAQNTTALCVAATGTPACPTGYPHAFVGYLNASDTRDCTTDCTCGAPSGAICGSPTVDGYDNDTTCTANGPHVIGPNTLCGPVGANAKVTVAATVTGGACMGSTITPTGSAEPLNPTTVCCTQ